MAQAFKSSACVFSFLLDKSKQKYRHMFNCMKLAAEEYKIELKPKKFFDDFEFNWLDHQQKSKVASFIFILSLFFFSCHENKGFRKM